MGGHSVWYVLRISSCRIISVHEHLLVFDRKGFRLECAEERNYHYGDIIESPALTRQLNQAPGCLDGA
jgi:hypothetical protein